MTRKRDEKRQHAPADVAPELYTVRRASSNGFADRIRQTTYEQGRPRGDNRGER